LAYTTDEVGMAGYEVVLTTVERAGQLVTVAAQEVVVKVSVIYRVLLSCARTALTSEAAMIEKRILIDLLSWWFSWEVKSDVWVS